MAYGETFEVDEVVGVTKNSRFERGAFLHRVVKANSRYITLDDGQVFLVSSGRPKGAGEYNYQRLIKGNEAIAMNRHLADIARARDAAQRVNAALATLKPIETGHSWSGHYRENVHNRVQLLREALAAAEAALAELA